MSSDSLVASTIEPVTKSVVVPLPLTEAFRRFTTDIGRWWPLRTVSVFGTAARTCTMDAGVGGRIYEVHADGRQAEWGRILVWEPPHRLMCSWYPGRGPDTAQELEITFQTTADGTRVSLVHRGWERMGEQGPATRARYDHGWNGVLNSFAP